MRRNRTAVKLCALAAVLWAAGGCGTLLSRMVGTQILVKSSRMSLREQVLGSYDEVGNEVFMLAGVRSVDPVSGAPAAPPRVTESEQSALDARRSMEFNRDDVQRFKRARYVGEGRDGKLVFFSEEKDRLAQEDPWLCKLVEDVTREENSDRERIMQRILETTPELTDEKGRSAVGQILAEKYRQEAETGVKVQDPESGQWTIKGEGRSGE
jgi:hypothetical protein